MKILSLLYFIFLASLLKISGQCSELIGLEINSKRFNTGKLIFLDKEGNINYDFEIPAVNEGAFPQGSLIQAGNNKLYGMTRQAGIKDCGIIFEWDPVTEVYIKKHDFDGLSGQYPCGSLISAGNDKLYGMTSEGGDYGQGIIFEWDPESNIFVKLFDFDALKNGAKPYGDLLQANNGKLYGMTSLGGKYYKGIVFELDLATSVLRIIKEFSGPDGSYPYGSLIQADNGKLYGMTSSGGTKNNGVLFSYNIPEDTVITEFNFNLKESGSMPMGSLYQASNGKLYGLTNQGGINYFGDGAHGSRAGTCGVLFEWDPLTQGFQKLYDFIPTGKNPVGSLIELNGKVYGGLGYSQLKIFSYDLLTREIEYFETNSQSKIAVSSLCKAMNGKLYGLNAGDMDIGYESGNLFEFNPDAKKINIKVEFNFKINGREPDALIDFGNGKMYGTTLFGGKFNLGTLFEWDKETRVFTKRIDFSDSTGGKNPSGFLLKTRNQKIIVVSSSVVSEWDPFTDEFHSIMKLDSLGQPQVVENDSGMVYLVFKTAIYSYDLESRTILKTFTPVGDQKLGYMKFYNGIAYGITAEQSNNAIFTWNPANGEYTKRADLSMDLRGLTVPMILTPEHVFYGPGHIQYNPGTNLYHTNQDIPYNILSMTQSLDGKFYYVAFNTCLIWDPDLKQNMMIKLSASTSIRYLVESHTPAHDTVKMDVCSPYHVPGSNCTYTRDGIYSICTKDRNGVESMRTIDLKMKGNSTFKTLYITPCGEYTSPSGKYRWNLQGKYTDTVPNCCGCDSIITVHLFPGKDVQNLEISACEYFPSPSGKYLWDSSGTYKDTLVNVHGCDSIFIINLTINKTTESSIDTTVCGSYISAGGKLFTSSGIYSDTISNNKGCYEIVTINLKVNPVKNISVSLAGCDSVISIDRQFTWKSSGIYTDTLTSSCNCDSLVVYHISINKSSENYINAVACNSYFSPGGYTWHSSGVYTDTITNVCGCDSIITFDLQFDYVDTNVVQNGNALISADRYANHQWIDLDNGSLPEQGETSYTFMANHNGRYAVILTQGTCVDTSAANTVIVTGNMQITGGNIQIYPNPNNGRFTLDLGKVYEEADIAVLTSGGQIIKEFKIRNSQKMEITFNETAGMYLLRITTSEGQRILKVFKE